MFWHYLIMITFEVDLLDLSIFYFKTHTIDKTIDKIEFVRDSHRFFCAFSVDLSLFKWEKDWLLNLRYTESINVKM